MMASYIVEAVEKENKNTENKHSILTTNRMQTIDKMETSLDALNEKSFNGGSSYLYSLDMKQEESKNKILCRKITMSEEDLNNPYIKQIDNSIREIENIIQNTKNLEEIPKLKAIIIELRKDKYFVKKCINPTINFNNLSFNKRSSINYEHITGYWDNGKYKNVNDSSFYFHNPKHIKALLNNFLFLKNYTEENLQSTMHWILIDFEQLVTKFEEGKYKDVLLCKLQDYSNEEIKDFLMKKYGETYSVTYISSLINKILPKMICEKYQEETLNWLYTHKMTGKWKICSKCGQIKLANRFNFSLNKRGKYGLHSVCKQCRSKEVKNKCQSR